MKNKVIIFFITALMFLTIIPCSSYAKYGGIDTTIDIGDTPSSRSSLTMTGRMLGIIQVLGSAISIGALIVIGIRYLFSSSDEKAATKGAVKYYLIGAILVFATTNVLSLAYKVISNIKI